MSFKLKKLRLDMELDLTVYIPGEAGIINPIKTSPEDLFNWMKYCTKIGDEAIALSGNKKVSSPEKVEETREQLIRQIDYLYGKGQNYWKAIPFPLLKEIINFLKTEVEKTEKK